MKLWEKGYALDKDVEKFMTGDDPLLDSVLAPYDCQASIAHAKMLCRIGILNELECQKLTAALQGIQTLAKNGKFAIPFEAEDVHTAIENHLVKELGELGKKIHAGRSRNDQVLVALRLYSKAMLLSVMKGAVDLCEILHRFAETHAKVPMPGRTHFQLAMPSSVGLWAGAFLESLLDDLDLLKTAYRINDQCPLGSAASYGAPLPLDRQYCADLLGFANVQNNVLYANNSRGKFEGIILSALSQVMNDLSKLCCDLILFSAPEFSYFSLPEKFCPGSSLMPQKRNPCPLELVRAKAATMHGLLVGVLEIVRTLPSGYNRDFQETKGPLMKGFEITLGSLGAIGKILKGVNVETQNCIGAFTPEVFATDHALELVKRGAAFRDAYRATAEIIGDLPMQDPVENILSKTHQGTTGNLCLHLSKNKIDQEKEWIEKSIRKNIN